MTAFSHELNTTVKLSANRSELADSYAFGMDIFEIRHRNLGALLQSLEDRGITKNRDQAQQVGALGASYLSQLKGGKKIGEGTARKIEVAMRRPVGWMDQPQWEPVEETAQLRNSHSLRLDPVMITETHRALRELEEDEGRNFSLEDEAGAARFALVYEMRAAMSEKPTQAEWVQFGRKLAAIKIQTGGDDGRSGGVPVEGTGTKGVARGLRRKA